MPTKKSYKGRLAFDPDLRMHVDEEGKPVVTEDDGKTWRYAVEGDLTHIARYQQRIVTIDSTANELAILAFKHGEEQANEMVSAHHWEATPDDEHYDENAEGKSNPQLDPDDVAETITSHTEAYA